MKKCTKCKKTKPESAFYRSKDSSDGRYPSCKQCKSATAKNWVANNKERSREIWDAWASNNADKISGYGKKYYGKNRERILKSQQAYRKENKEKINERNRERYWRNRPQELKRSREYKRKNRNLIRQKGREYRAKNIEKTRESVRNWYHRNKDKVYESCRRRRARIVRATGSFTKTEFDSLCEQFNERCLRCGRQVSLTADHVIPLYRGGNNSIENIQPLCGRCNSAKGVRIIDYRKSVKRRKTWLQNPLPLHNNS